MFICVRRRQVSNLTDVSELATENITWLRCWPEATYLVKLLFLQSNNARHCLTANKISN
jgi:hypothetical protein